MVWQMHIYSHVRGSTAVGADPQFVCADWVLIFKYSYSTYSYTIYSQLDTL